MRAPACKLPKQWAHWCCKARLWHGWRGHGLSLWRNLRGRGLYWRVTEQGEFVVAKAKDAWVDWERDVFKRGPVPRTQREFLEFVFAAVGEINHA